MRRTAILVTLALLGVGAAMGIGLAANAISGDSVGLSAKPLRAGETLAPAAAQRGTGRDATTRARRERRRRRGRSGGSRTTTPTSTTPAAPTVTAPATPVPTTPTTTIEPGDDSGGHGRGRGGSGSGSGGDD